MKRYRLSFAASLTHIPDHPERTARRTPFDPRDPMSMDVEYQVWPNRAAMLKTIEIQGRSEPRPDHWRAYG